MNFGLLFIVRNPLQWHLPDSELYRSYLDHAVLGEKLGYIHAWVDEHHFRGDGIAAPSPLVTLAAIAVRTEHIRIGTFVLLPAMQNPIRLAEDIATVDIISNGRFDLGVGFGGDVEENQIFGIPYKERRGRVYEGLEIIRRCFEEESFSYKGKYYQFDNVRMTTKPVQKPLPFWLGAGDDRSLKDAGARGLHLAAGPTAEKQQIYDDALRSAGHKPKDFQRAIHKMVHVAETTEKAWDEAEAHLQNHMIWHVNRLKLRAHLPVGHDLSIPALGELRHGGRGPYGPPAVGSPDEVIRILEAFFKTNPVTELEVTPGFPGMDPRVARNSMELFAKEVMPHFRKN